MPRKTTLKLAQTKRYASVMEMVRSTSSPAFVAEFEKYVTARRIVEELTVRRVVLGLSQKDLARALGCTQGRISKLEYAKDADVRLGALAEYAAGVGLKAKLVLEPEGSNGSTRAKRVEFSLEPETDSSSGKNAPSRTAAMNRSPKGKKSSRKNGRPRA